MSDAIMRSYIFAHSPVVNRVIMWLATRSLGEGWCPQFTVDTRMIQSRTVVVAKCIKIHEPPHPFANALSWCPQQESDLRLVLTKDLFYHYTMRACAVLYTAGIRLQQFLMGQTLDRVIHRRRRMITIANRTCRTQPQRKTHKNQFKIPHYSALRIESTSTCKSWNKLLSVSPTMTTVSAGVTSRPRHSSPSISTTILPVASTN